jgi:hypothetical protein
MSVKIIDRIGGTSPPVLPRRDLLKAGGVTLVSVALLGGCQTATGINPAIPPAAKVLQNSRQTTPTPAARGMQLAQAAEAIEKPTYVAERRDPVAYSLADNLFWNDILMEHALFFVLLMPGRELEGPRGQAEEFQRLFASQFQQSANIDDGNYVAFNQSSVDLARRFVDYKKAMQEQQEAGELKSLVWPLFFDHTAREADRFAQRLALYSRGEIDYERSEVVDFWSQIMSEHAAFIAHLLDPQEELLIDQAGKLQMAFADPAALNAGQGDPVLDAAEEILDFKTVGEKGIRSGAIKSIIRPELAAHVRREAVRFIDELQRTKATM